GTDGSDDGSATADFTVDGATTERVGDQVQLEISVTNSGNAPVESLVAKSNVGDMSCQSTSLAPGESTTCTVTFTPSGGTETITVMLADAVDPSTAEAYQFTYRSSGNGDGTDSTAGVIGVSNVTGGGGTVTGVSNVTGGVSPISG